MKRSVLLAIVVVIFAVFLSFTDRIEKSKQKNIEQISTDSQQEVEPGKPNSVNSQNGTLLIESNLILNIAQPQDGVVVKSANLTVSGKTAPNADVFVNDSEAKADSSGNFFANIVLDEGDNDIVVAVNDSTGAFLEKSIIVAYEP